MNHIAYSLLELTGQEVIARDNDFDSEIERLEYKINLVIQMLGQLTQPSQARPKPVLLRLGAETIAWQDSQAQIGQRYIVTLYLNETVAIPIQACVEIVEKSANWCVGRFTSQTPDEQSAWERWVFRLHRRQIAHEKEQLPKAN